MCSTYAVCVGHGPHCASTEASAAPIRKPTVRHIDALRGPDAGSPPALIISSETHVDPTAITMPRASPHRMRPVAITSGSFGAMDSRKDPTSESGAAGSMVGRRPMWSDSGPLIRSAGMMPRT